MRKNTEIRLERLFQCLFRNNTAFVFRNSFMQFPQNSLFSFSPQQAMVWENNIAEKIYAPVQFADTDFSGMKFQSQPIVQKFSDWFNKIFKKSFAVRNYYEVVRITNVIFNLQAMFNKLVKLVEIDISKKLGSQITDGQSLCLKKIRVFGFETLYDFFKNQHHIGVFDSFCKQGHKDSMVNCPKKFLNVAFKSETRLMNVVADCLRYAAQNIYSFMRSFADTTRQRMCDKCRLKNRIQHAENCVMEHSISDYSFVNVPLFGVLNIKRSICFVLILFIFQIPMKLKNVLLKLPFKLNNIPFFLFIATKLIPRRKQIFQ